MSTAAMLLEEFAKNLELSDLVFEEGICSIAFDDTVVHFYDDADAGELLLFTALMLAPEEAEERGPLYRRLAVINGFGRLTGGGALGVDRDENEVIYSRGYALNGLTALMLEEKIAAFLERGQLLADELNRSGEEEEEDAERRPDAGLRV
jgi:hypothetical protein